MLEGILVVLYIIVVIIRIGEETVARGKYIRGTQVRCRQLGAVRLFDGEHFLALVSQILAQLVAQVGVRIAVAYYLDWFRCPDAAVVGGEHYLVIALRKELEELGENRMAEPALRDAAVGTLVVGKLAHHLRFGTRVREHVDEVNHQHVQVVVAALVVMLQEAVGTLRIVHLVITEGIVLSESLYLGLYQRRLVQVLAFFLVLIYPEVREHFGYLVRHQTAEDGVARILRGGRKDAHVELLINVEQVADVFSQHAPLVIAEVIYHNQEHLLALIEQREYLALEDVGTHQMAVSVVGTYPVEIVLGYVFGEPLVSLFLLHAQHLCHRTCRIAQLQFPANQSPVNLHPVFRRSAFHHLHGYLLVVLLVSALRHLRHDVFAVDVLLEREQNLVRVYGFDQIVGYL